MIYIEDDDEEIRLPKQYHKINNLCAILYDQITEIIFEDQYDSFKASQITLNPEKQKLTEEIRDHKIHLLDWLKANDLNQELTSVLRKHVTMSIMVDFAHFMFESLSCAKRGKMTVAYALLRKPLTDELLLLEQLLYDPADFIQRFYHSGDPEGYDPGKAPEKRKTIIQNAISKIKGNLMFTDELVFDLRYNKTSPGGINGVSNTALHIVTGDKNYKTERQSLNMVLLFNQEDEELWGHYYNFVPYLLLYSVSVIDNIVFQELNDEKDKDLFALKAFRRAVGLVFLSEWTYPDSVERNQEMFDLFSEHIKIDCPNCKKLVNFNKNDFELYFDSELLICPTCIQDLSQVPGATKVIREFIESTLPH